MIQLFLLSIYVERTRNSIHEFKFLLKPKKIQSKHFWQKSCETDKKY